MVAIGEIAKVLGLGPAGRPASALALIERIEGGLPVRALERVAHLVAPQDARFKFRVVPKATFERRKAAHRLSGEESARLARLARVWSLAHEVWGSEEAARAFLFRPHPMIEDRRPIDVVLQNELGGELVLEILGGLKYGTAA